MSGWRGTARGSGADGSRDIRQRAVAAVAPSPRQDRTRKSGNEAVSVRSFSRRLMVKS
jgi:hypothetical protein